MSDGEDDYDSDYGVYEASIDPQDSGGFGPLVPTESERTLMERVRQELKYELKQVNSASCPSMGKPYPIYFVKYLRWSEPISLRVGGF